MNKERFEQVNRLFLEAQRLAGEQRQACLDTACAGDPELRHEVDALLDADHEADLALATAHVRGEVGRAAAESIALPESIGQYRIIRLIGEGGMGSVYEAEQDDPRRRVALKVIRPGIVSPKLLGRFRHEAQVLGQLRHQGIAQIYEAGTEDRGEGGQPYFAMELVTGRSLPEYAERQNLGTRDRLALVARVCDALHHAHQKGVIHRDLKPGNVLVEAGGQPKILDFGVARATDADIQTVTLATDIGELVGTVPYMSPEQASGDPDALDIRSDIYALGVISFELLGGRLPYQVAGKMIHEAVRVIREEEPSRLSSIDRTLRGDVETIVAKALEKDKDRRYQSAAELAADIRRYLNDEPIVARPASTFYQLSKFAKRNKALVGASAVVAVVLVVATTLSTASAIGEARARKDADGAAALAREKQTEAEQQTAIAAAVNEFLNVDLLAAVDPYQQGRDVTMLEVLDTAAANIEGRFAEQPVVEAEIRSTIGNTYLALGRHDLAVPFFQRSLELREKTLGERHPDTMTAYNRMGRLMQRLARHEEAERYYGRCLELRREVLGEEAELTLTTLINLAGLLRQKGRFEDAMALYREADVITQRILEPDAEQRLHAMLGLAGAYKDLGRHDDAIPIYETVLGIRQRIDAGTPAVPLAMNNLAVAYMRAGRYEEAGRLLTDAMDRHVELFTEKHPITLACMANLARVKMFLGQLEESERLFERAVELNREVNGLDHRGTLITMTYFAQLYGRMDRLGEAESMYLQVNELARNRYGETFPSTLASAYELAKLYIKKDHAAEGEPLAAAAVVGARQTYGPAAYRTGLYLRTWGRCLRQVGRFEEAESVLLESHEILEASRGADHTDTVEVIEALVDLYDAWGRPQPARDWTGRLGEC